MPAIPARVRLAGIGLLVVLLVHLTLVKLSPDSSYAQSTSFSKLRYGSAGNGYPKGNAADLERLYGGNGKTNTSTTSKQERASAAFVILARNSDLWSILESIRFMEDRFNHKYK